MSAVLRTEGLTRRLPGEVPVTLVDQVSVNIEKGEFICIMGPSGSGKSSLLYLLGLLDRPDQGRIWLEDKEVTGSSEDELAGLRLAKLGFVFQFHFLLPEFTVLDNVLLPIRRAGLLAQAPARERALQLLERFGIADQRAKLPSQLSGGQRQRVALARAMANAPLLLLADEPTGNLDSAATANVRDTLRELADGGQTVIAVTHDASFAAAADRCIGLVDGHVDQDWLPAALRAPRRPAAP